MTKVETFEMKKKIGSWQNIRRSAVRTIPHLISVGMMPSCGDERACICRKNYIYIYTYICVYMYAEFDFGGRGACATTYIYIFS